jgi:hypothetical protein
MNSRPELRCIQTGVRRIVSYLVIATFLFHFVTTAAALPLEENIFQDPVSGQTVGVVASLRSLYRNPAPGGVATSTITRCVATATSRSILFSSRHRVAELASSLSLLTAV